MISLSHAPNATEQQQSLCRQWLRPWSVAHWKQGKDVPQLESWFASRYKASDAIGFSTGREALYAILQALGIGHGDEVLIQAYTCIVVPHAILWSGARPVYVDIDSSLNIDAELMESAITPRTKAVIVQHTFGMPANLRAIMEICKRRGLLLIEDVAHAFGARYQNQDVGTFGDAAMFSFGRDKAISSTAGGIALAKNPGVAKRLQAIADASPYPSLLTIKQNLLHPLIIPWCAKQMGRRRLGSVVLRIAQALRLVNRVYTRDELDSKPPSILTRRLPNAMASLAWQQLQDHHELFLAHRKKLAKTYTQWANDHTLSAQVAPDHAAPSWLRFTVFVQHPQTLIAIARSHGYQLGDWYTAVIMPKPHDAQLLGYQAGSCLKAEQAARTSVNLPTHIHMTQADAESLTALLSSQV